MLRILKRFGISIEELRVVYGGFVRPILEYTDVVRHSSITFKQSCDIESIQRRACHIILGNSYQSYVDALGSCHFDTLFERRENHCRMSAEGLRNNELTKSLLPPSRFECHGRSLLTVPIFLKYLLGQSALKIVLFLILSKFQTSSFFSLSIAPF